MSVAEAGEAWVDYTAAMLEESEKPESDAVEADAASTEPPADSAAQEVAADLTDHVDAADAVEDGDTIDANEVDADEVIDVDAGETPSVDELQARLADLQGAMDLLQSGDLDGAEATIASLEQAMAEGNPPS